MPPYYVIPQMAQRLIASISLLTNLTGLVKYNVLIKYTVQLEWYISEKAQIEITQTKALANQR